MSSTTSPVSGNKASRAEFDERCAADVADAAKVVAARAKRPAAAATATTVPEAANATGPSFAAVGGAGTGADGSGVVPKAWTDTFTITFGDVAENHAGMQKLGSAAASGFSLADLTGAKDWFEKAGVTTELVHLNTFLPADVTCDADAYVLIARGGLTAFCSPDAWHAEQAALTKDKMALMYGRVVEKRARHNLCFAAAAQEACIAEGKGTVVAFDSVPLLEKVRTALPGVLGSKAEGLLAEGNYYFDLNSTGIGWHGDAERRRVVGCRTGASMTLAYQWFQHSKPVGSMCRLVLHHGDVYVMGDKAVGYDWRRPSRLTLRHAAGAAKFLVLPKKDE